MKEYGKERRLAGARGYKGVLIWETDVKSADTGGKRDLKCRSVQMLVCTTFMASRRQKKQVFHKKHNQSLAALWIFAVEKVNGNGNISSAWVLMQHLTLLW